MESRRSYAISALQAVALAVFLWYILMLDMPWNVQRLVGTALLGVGTILVVIARFQLGTSFAVRARAHRLVTHGLYSKIRNPVYLFGTVMFAGVILIMRAPLLWFILAALVVLQIIRAHREAIVLERAFGDAYRRYRQGTWF
jgi:protein-S-isoprenylcysteine O-methyltransferase Ste14